MRGFLKILFVVLFIFSFTILPHRMGLAQIHYPLITTYVNTDTSAAIAAGKEIYGYTILASGGNGATCALYDVATIAASSSSNVISEASEAVQWDSNTIWFPKPLVTANGCSVAVHNSEVIIYHQP